jgi:hypothetical protein
MTAAKRWVLYAVAASGTAAAMAWVERRDAVVQPMPHPMVASASAPAEPPARHALALPLRVFTEPTSDLFELTDAPFADVPFVRADAIPLAASAIAPALPYAYVGRWIEGGSTVAFLTTPQGINVAARVGATLDRTYRVEAIDPQGMTFSYLPLGQRQRMIFADEQPSAAAAPSGPTPPAVTELEESN